MDFQRILCKRDAIRCDSRKIGDFMKNRQEQRQFRVHKAETVAKRREMDFDAFIGDEGLKEAIKAEFHDVDMENGYVNYIYKYTKTIFLSKEWFNQLTELQYNVVVAYIDSLTELTFAEAALMKIPAKETYEASSYPY